MRRASLRGAGLLVLLFVIAACGAASAFQATKLDQRQAVIHRALDFVYATGAQDANLGTFGADILWCFYSISHTSSDRQLRAEAAHMGRDLAQRWRNLNQHVPDDATPIAIYNMVMGSYAAERLGLPDSRFKKELRDAAQRFTARDYLRFDALHEPPSPDDPSVMTSLLTLWLEVTLATPTAFPWARTIAMW